MGVPDVPNFHQKKLYAEVHAKVSFETSNRSDTYQLIESFLSRRGLTKQGHTVWKGNRVTVEVTYRVHGGWRSDFVKKIESDANDLDIEVKSLDVKVIRKTIPNECPRKSCFPCSVARGERPPVFEEEVADRLSRMPPVPFTGNYSDLGEEEERRRDVEDDILREIDTEPVTSKRSFIEKLRKRR